MTQNDPHPTNRPARTYTGLADDEDDSALYGDDGGSTSRRGSPGRAGSAGMSGVQKFALTVLAVIGVGVLATLLTSAFTENEG